MMKNRELSDLLSRAAAALEDNNGDLTDRDKVCVIEDLYVEAAALREMDDSEEKMIEEWRMLKVFYGSDTGLVALRNGVLLASTWDTSRVSMMSGLAEVVVEDHEAMALFGDEHSWDDVIGMLRKHYQWENKTFTLPVKEAGS